MMRFRSWFSPPPFLLSLVLVFAFTPSGAARRGKRRTAAPALPGRSVSGICSFALLHSFCDCLRPDPPCLICPILSGSAEAASTVVVASHLRPPSTIRTTAQRGNRARRMNREREAVRRCAAFRVSRRGDFMLRPLPLRSPCAQLAYPTTARDGVRQSSLCALLRSASQCCTNSEASASIRCLLRPCLRSRCWRTSTRKGDTMRRRSSATCRISRLLQLQTARMSSY